MNTKITDKIPGILRGVGATALLLSGLTFLVQGIQDANSTERLIYFMFLNLTVLLTGVFCGSVIKEAKGARASLGTGLALLPLYFLQVSAVLYAMVGNVAGMSYPSLLKFDAIPDFFTGIVVVASMVIFGFLIWLAFRCLSKAGSLVFTIGYLSLNSLLLLPFRGASASIIISVLALCGLMYIEKHKVYGQAAFNTFEAKYCRLLLFVPLMLVVVRNIVLYEATFLLLSFAFAAISIIVTHVVTPYYKKQDDIFSANSLIVSLSWVLFILEFVKYSFFAEHAYILIAIPLGLYQYRVATQIKSRQKRHYRLGTLLIAGGAIMQVLTMGSVLDTFVALFVGMALVAYGWHAQHKSAIKLGVLTFAIAIVRHMELAYDLYTISPWFSLGLTGIVVVIMSSYLEKNYSKLQHRFQKISAEMNSWE